VRPQLGAVRLLGLFLRRLGMVHVGSEVRGSADGIADPGCLRRYSRRRRSTGTCSAPLRLPGFPGGREQVARFCGREGVGFDRRTSGAAPGRRRPARKGPGRHRQPANGGIPQGIDTATALGRTFVQILGAMAEFEHALMWERTRRTGRGPGP
jgi:hypothetical protein